jgi:hypothetical protein
MLRAVYVDNQRGIGAARNSSGNPTSSSARSASTLRDESATPSPSYARGHVWKRTALLLVGVLVVLVIVRVHQASEVELDVVKLDHAITAGQLTTDDDERR